MWFILLPIHMTGHRRLQMAMAVSNAMIREIMRFGAYQLVVMVWTTDGIQWMILSQLISVSKIIQNHSCCTALGDICCDVCNAITFLWTSQGIKVTAIVKNIISYNINKIRSYQNKQVLSTYHYKWQQHWTTYLLHIQIYWSRRKVKLWEHIT